MAETRINQTATTAPLKEIGSATHVSDRSDSQTILGIGAIAKPIIESTMIKDASAPSLNHRVATEAEQIVEMAQNIEKQFDNVPAEIRSTGYMVRLRTLVSDILEQFTKVAENERAQKERYKQEFKQSNLRSGDLGVEVGNRSFYSSVAAVGAIAGSVAIPLFFPKAQHSKPFLEYLAREGATHIATGFNARTNREQKIEDGKGQIASQYLGSLLNKGPEQNKELYIRLLDEISQLLKRAAQGQ